MEIYFIICLFYFASNFDYALNYINKAIKISINNDIYKIKSEIYINRFNIDEVLNILRVLKKNDNIQKDNNKEIRVNILLANAYKKKRV